MINPEMIGIQLPCRLDHVLRGFPGWYTLRKLLSQILAVSPFEAKFLLRLGKLRLQLRDASAQTHKLGGGLAYILSCIKSCIVVFFAARCPPIVKPRDQIVDVSLHGYCLW